MTHLDAAGDLAQPQGLLSLLDIRESVECLEDALDGGRSPVDHIADADQSNYGSIEHAHVASDGRQVTDGQRLKIDNLIAPDQNDGKIGYLSDEVGIDAQYRSSDAKVDVERDAFADFLNKAPGLPLFSAEGLNDSNS